MHSVADAHQMRENTFRKKNYRKYTAAAAVRVEKREFMNEEKCQRKKKNPNLSHLHFSANNLRSFSSSSTKNFPIWLITNFIKDVRRKRAAKGKKMMERAESDDEADIDPKPILWLITRNFNHLH